jgi:Phage protein (N4 Gp49/phage Sf6 gene 66) family
METDQERAARTMLSSVKMTDLEAQAVQKTRFRVSLDDLLAKIETEEYLNPRTISHMTICVLVTNTGYALIGTSAPADAENYDEDLGKKFAKEDAIRQMWKLEAYLLCERMSL